MHVCQCCTASVCACARTRPPVCERRKTKNPLSHCKRLPSQAIAPIFRAAASLSLRAHAADRISVTINNYALPLPYLVLARLHVSTMLMSALKAMMNCINDQPVNTAEGAFVYYLKC